jgi:hypothetical protein
MKKRILARTDTLSRNSITEGLKAARFLAAIDQSR